MGSLFSHYAAVVVDYTTTPSSLCQILISRPIYEWGKDLALPSEAKLMDRAKPSAADFFFLIPLKKYTGTFPGAGKQAIASRSCKSFFLLWGRWGNSLVRNSVE